MYSSPRQGFTSRNSSFWPSQKSARDTLQLYLSSAFWFQTSVGWGHHAEPTSTLGADHIGGPRLRPASQPGPQPFPLSTSPCVGEPACKEIWFCLCHTGPHGQWQGGWSFLISGGTALLSVPRLDTGPQGGSSWQSLLTEMGSFYSLVHWEFFVSTAWKKIVFLKILWQEQ